MSDTPQPNEHNPETHYTHDQTTALFVQQAMVIVDQWDKVDLTDYAPGQSEQKSRIAGAVHSVLAMIDGASMGMPPCCLSVLPPDPEDVEDRVGSGIKEFYLGDLSGDLASSFLNMNKPDHELSGFRKEYQDLYIKHMGLDQFIKPPQGKF